jgi:flagellar motor switch/type III secretory pathway protein FliN
VSVELARFTMPLEELGALRTGEVVATGRAVGERVTLRAGGHALAVGELVDVDGEVGVRLLRVGSDQGADQK